MQVWIDVKCMHINFGGHDFSGFRDIVAFQVWPNFPAKLCYMYMYLIVIVETIASLKLCCNQVHAFMYSNQLEISLHLSKFLVQWMAIICSDSVYRSMTKSLHNPN